MNKKTRDLLLNLVHTQEELIKPLRDGTKAETPLAYMHLADKMHMVLLSIENAILMDGAFLMSDGIAEPIVSPYDIYFTDKSSALKSIKQDIAKLYPFVMCYACKDEMLTYFATLLMNYSNHDKRDVELRLEEVEHLYKIRWCLIADHEILDCGDYIIDKDVPF